MLTGCVPQGVSGVSQIESFDTDDYSTRFAGNIKEFECNGYVNKKMARRMDNTIKYIMVSGKKVGGFCTSHPLKSASHAAYYFLGLQCWALS